MRDLRDLTVLGGVLLEVRAQFVGHSFKLRPLSVVYDEMFEEMGSIPDYDGSNDIRPRVESGAEH